MWLRPSLTKVKVQGGGAPHPHCSRWSPGAPLTPLCKRPLLPRSLGWFYYLIRDISVLNTSSGFELA